MDAKKTSSDIHRRILITESLEIFFVCFVFQPPSFPAASIDTEENAKRLWITPNPQRYGLSSYSDFLA